MNLSRRDLICSGLLGITSLRHCLAQSTSEAQQPRLSLGIVSATVAVPDVKSAASTYCRWFEYTTLWEGKVTAEQAAAWDALKVVGHPTAVIGLRGSTVGLIRFVESTAKAPPALTTIGWSAIEIRVRDVDRLMARLEGSPFKRIGGPSNAALLAGGFRRSAQSLGLAGETLYFTQNLTAPEDPAPGGLLSQANVGTVFIMVLAARILRSACDFYAGILGAESGPARSHSIGIINRALGLDVETPGRGHEGDDHGPTIMLTGIRVGTNHMIEVDGFPASARERVVLPGDLSPGISLVSIAVIDLEKVASRLKDRAIPFRRVEHALPSPPYQGGRTLVCRGHSGEVLEFMEWNHAWPTMSGS